MENYLLLPPVAFVTVLLIVFWFSHLISFCAYKPKKVDQEARTTYACGEDFKDNMIQPDYEQFFPFAFYFTILHVVALMIATVPIKTMETTSIAVIYIVGAVIGLSILLRRN